VCFFRALTDFSNLSNCLQAALDLTSPFNALEVYGPDQLPILEYFSGQFLSV
jgi:hypothetical protein